MMLNRFGVYRASLIAASLASVPELLKNDRTSAAQRRDRGHLLGEPHLRLVIEIRTRHVQELARLLDDGGARRQDANGRSI